MQPAVCQLLGKGVWLVIFVYLSSLPVAHLSDAPRRRLVVTGDSERIPDETTESSTWFFNMRAMSPFPTVFSKVLFPRGVIRCHCVCWNG